MEEKARLSVARFGGSAYNPWPMATFAPLRSQPITLEPSKEAAVYGLLAVAMAVSAAGIFLGLSYAVPLISSGLALILLLVELGVLLTSRLWMNISPLNYILFGVVPFLSGFTIAPYILYLLQGYANGGTILLNATLATACLTAAGAVLGRATNINLSGLSGILLVSIIGLLVLGILQIFVPALQTTLGEMIISGLGIVVFSIYIAFDVQRAERLARTGANPFMLALSLYLDIFNLFLYILRFMVAVSGRRD